MNEFYDNFQPPLGFKVPENFLIARGKTVYIKKLNRAESALKSGIYVPTTSRDVVPEGRIYGVGPDVTDLKPGMRVLYNYYANMTILHEGIEYYMLSEIDVFGILPAEEDLAMVSQLKVEERKQYSYDEMPLVDQSTKESREAEEEFGRIGAEMLKKDATTKIFAVNGTKKDIN